MLFVTVVGRYNKDISQTSQPGYVFLQKTIRDLPGAERVAYSTQLETKVIYSGAQRVETQLRRATPSYWQIFDFHFIEGAPFTAVDDAADRPIAVITDALRDKVLGTGPAVGRTINIGGQSQLCWQVENATTVSISGGIGTVEASGCRTVNPTVTTTYVLTATNAGGTVCHGLSPHTASSATEPIHSGSRCGPARLAG